VLFTQLEVGFIQICSGKSLNFIILRKSGLSDFEAVEIKQ
jgi:hypothetical protein